MEAERQIQLELLEASNDAAEQAHHRAVARFIRGFLDPSTGVEAQLRAAHSANLERARTAAAHKEPDRPYMELDSQTALND